jgi:hypothetical protein
VIDGAAFHFSAWQVLFFTPLIIGYHRRAVAARFGWLRPEVVLVISSILLFVCIGLYWTQLRPLAALLPGIGHGQLAVQFFDKANVRCARLLTFAVVAAFAWSVTTLAWTPVQRAFGWLVLPLGQRALTAYSVHVFVVAILGWVIVDLWRVPRQSIGANTMVQVLGLAMVWTWVRAVPRLTSLAHRWDELEHRLLAEVEHVLTQSIAHH